MRRLLALFAFFALVCGRAAPAADSAVTADGAHYRLVATGTQAEADDWLKMLEAAWPLYAEFFGKAPLIAKGAHLDVRFFETLADMQNAIRNAGGAPPPDAGGYFDPVSKTAFAWRQPSIWYTRTLILHECAHQFHRLGRVAPNVSPPAWYGEGVVEHLSHHTWDGEHLRLGVVPMLSLEDIPGKALDVVKRGAFALEDVLDGKSPAGRPECMHLVRYLRGTDVDVPPGTDGTWVVEALRDGTSVKFVVNGKSVAATESESKSMGLAVDACVIDFTEIRAE